MRGLNPRLLAHKTNTLPTELMELFGKKIMQNFSTTKTKNNLSKKKTQFY